MTSTFLDEAKTVAGCSAILKLIENDRTTKERKLISTPAPVYLQIEFSKIPKITKRTIRIPLKNSLLTENSDVCLILADVIRGRNVNHELTIDRFKKIIEKKGISRKLHLITSRQIRIEFTTFEAKRKLSKMFDVFLVDEKISKYVHPKLGKEFSKARKWPIPIRMRATNLNNEIESKLMKSSLALDGSGNNKTIQIGHFDMTPEQLAENVSCVANYIAENFPSGWDNIRSLYLKGMRSQSIPIFMSLLSKNLISEPKVISKSRNTIVACNELSTNGEKVLVYRSGKIKVLKRKNAQKSESDSETEDDVSDKKKLKLDKLRRMLQ